MRPPCCPQLGFRAPAFGGLSLKPGIELQQPPALSEPVNSLPRLPERVGRAGDILLAELKTGLAKSRYD